MANAALRPMLLSYQEGDYSSPSNWQPEGATQVFLAGAPLIWSSGNLVESAAATVTAIFGISNGPGHNTTAGTTQAMVGKVTPEQIYEISIDKASAQGGALAVLAASNLGATIGLTRDSSGVWYADVDKMAANQCATIYGFPVFTPPGTVNGRVWVKFLPANVAD